MLETILILTLVILSTLLIVKNIALEQKIIDLEFQKFMQVDLERVLSPTEVNESTNSERKLQ